MSKDIVACTLLIPNTGDTDLSTDRAVARPVELVAAVRSEGGPSRAGTVPTRVDSFVGGTMPHRIPVRSDALPCLEELETAARTPDPDLRYVALSEAHDDLQAFITANPNHPSTDYLMDCYFSLRGNLPADVLGAEMEENTDRLNHFEISRFTRPDGGEIIVNRTAEGRSVTRIEIEPGTIETFH